VYRTELSSWLTLLGLPAEDRAATGVNEEIPLRQVVRKDYYRRREAETQYIGPSRRTFDDIVLEGPKGLFRKGSLTFGVLVSHAMRTHPVASDYVRRRPTKMIW
jgi:hypothetical protein